MWNSLEPKDKANFILKIIKYTLISLPFILSAIYGYDYLERNLKWFFVNKTTNTSANTVQIHFGERDALISRQFSDASQACWYYYGEYEHLHPYILWSAGMGNSNESNFPKIRVIAEANWDARNCAYDEPQFQVKLLGVEYTKHRIEVQLSKNSDFIHIANSYAYYGSELIFDNVGRIRERKILSPSNNHKFNCKIFGLNKENTLSDCKSDKKESRKEKDRKEKIEELAKETNLHFNDLEIVIAEEKYNKLSKDEIVTISSYIEKRKDLHEKLAQDGCGVITIEPVLKNKSYGSVKPAIAFLCFKDDVKSHVRLMIKK